MRWCDDRRGPLCLNPGYNPDAPFPNYILVRTDDLSCEFITAARGADWTPGEMAETAALEPAGA